MGPAFSARPPVSNHCWALSQSHIILKSSWENIHIDYSTDNTVLVKSSTSIIKKTIISSHKPKLLGIILDNRFYWWTWKKKHPLPEHMKRDHKWTVMNRQERHGDKKAILSSTMCIYPPPSPPEKKEKSCLKGSMKEFVKGVLQMAIYML